MAVGVSIAVSDGLTVPSVALFLDRVREDIAGLSDTVYGVREGTGDEVRLQDLLFN